MSRKSCKPKGRCTACTPCGRRPCTAWQGPRSIARLGRTVITYRLCMRRTAAAWLLVVALVVAGGALGLLPVLGAVAAAVVLGWAAGALRVLRLDPVCPDTGGAGPGGMGVREPRRPKPVLPQDRISRPLPERPDDGAAWV
ncbi:hypothetical protein OG440_39915 (plasmid) [Streptomyces sp. NBC_00637]|uniref:hypothetical protein n=1 Tax=Streptomyces sp. NBC_00637 TaxID=2903667 RepID=UPI0032559677